MIYNNLFGIPPLFQRSAEEILSIRPEDISKYDPKTFSEKKYEGMLEELDKIKRFQDSTYPEGMIEDTDRTHISRLPGILIELHNINPLLFRDLDLTIVWRMLDLHDMPETIVGDTVATAVYNGTSEKPDDLEAADKLMSKKDYALYETFVSVEKALRKKPLSKGFDPDHFEFLLLRLQDMTYFTEAFVAKMIDVLDGNNHFNRSLVDFRNNNHMELPPDRALIYPFVKHEQFIAIAAILSELEPLEDVAELINFISTQAVNNISYMWATSGIKRGLHMIPGCIRKTQYVKEMLESLLAGE